MVIMTTLPPPTEGIRHKQCHTQAHMQGRKISKDLGTGELYIAESRLAWVNVDGQGFSLEYPSISLHAVSKDLNAFPQECLYVLIDADLEDQGSDSSSSSESNPVTEIRFIPEDKTTLDAMYGAMCECQALHPDDQDSLSDDEEYYIDGGSGDHLTEEGQSRLERLDGLLNVDEGDGQDFDAEPQIGNRATTNGTDHSTAEADEPMETGQFEDADI